MDAAELSRSGTGGRTALTVTAVTGLLAVALGAFGAHALEAFLEEAGRTGTWETAVLYHLVHAGILLLLCLVRPWRPRTWGLFFAGVTVFSGSLYVLCLTGIGWLGAVTPVGGLLLILGWLSLAFSQTSLE